MSIPLDEMSVAEKLQALEEIWADLARDPESVPAPDWHREALEGREQRVKEGTASFEEWDVVKQRLRDQTR